MMPMRENGRKRLYIWLGTGSTVIGLLTHNPKIKGSNPARREKMTGEWYTSGVH
jgi:hypothetical protein